MIETKNKKYSEKCSLILAFVFILLFSAGAFVYDAFADVVTNTISVDGAYGIAVNSKTNMIYVATNHGYSVQVIDGNTNSVTSTITTINNPTVTSSGCSTAFVAVNPVTNMIYAHNGGCLYNQGRNSFQQSLTVINGTTNSVVVTLSLGNPTPSFPLAVDSLTNKIYVLTSAENISVIDGATNSVVNTIPLCCLSFNLSINQDTNKIYVTNSYNNIISVIDGATNSVVNTVSTGTFPFGVSVNSDTNKIYVTNKNSNTTSVIDGTTNSVVNTVIDVNTPFGVDVNPVTNKVYQSNYNSGTVSVIDGTTNSVVNTVSVGNTPWNIAINPTTNKIYVANSGSNTISVIDDNPTQSLPQAPTNLSTNTISSSQINLSWIAPSKDGGSQITGYMIQRSTDNGATWSTIVSNTASTDTAYSDTGLVHSATYTYQISAINSIGSSLPSNIASATTFNIVPSSPTSLTGTGMITHIDLTWVAPSDNGGTSLLGYVIQRSTDNGTTWNTIVSNTNSTGTTYTDSHLIPVKTYSYQVYAINSVGMSDSSNIVSTKPLSIPHLVSVSKTDEMHSK